MIRKRIIFPYSHKANHYQIHTDNAYHLYSPLLGHMVASLSHVREINVTLGDVREGEGGTVDSMSHRAGKIPYLTLRYE